MINFIVYYNIQAIDHLFDLHFTKKKTFSILWINFIVSSGTIQLMELKGLFIQNACRSYLEDLMCLAGELSLR